MSARDVFVVGVAETPLGRVTDHSELSMVAVAAREALDEAGLEFDDVDALFTNYMGDEGTVQIGEYLGIEPRYCDTTDIGGASYEAHVHHAMLALAADRCEVALIAYASRQRSKRSRAAAIGGDPELLMTQFEQPNGLPLPIGHFALMAARHMHDYGTTPEQLASVAVTARRWAAMNPKAWARDPLTVDDVLASPLLSDPLHKLDMCLITDGGGVAILTTEARARGARKRPVRVLGAGESHTHWQISQMADLTRTSVARAGRDAFAMAGVTPDDVDVLQMYDAATITPILQLEDLGFCARGEGGAFFADGNCLPGGRLPAQTSGGGLSYNHPGALGLLLLVEAVRQLRGECGERQVPDAEIAVASGIGGLFSCAATVVMARD